MEKSENKKNEIADNEQIIGFAGNGAYLNFDDPYPGDSVNEHKQLEIANEVIGKEEVKQQNENL
ncbi:hypothetical protein JOC86_000627 [Bacillus pakistanensis]|uniref:Uncharacterized protein n=1 Tax=Rossellomorea pakistanensis TaxID=992288 RepID=A0ABS2N894_9BACI|nr:hypothetical protein [Bacillus pakistanensis]MBM7584090.1 hypothetical protein [Bacillus pakistanensis]